MNNWHPYVARVNDGRTCALPAKGLVRAKARKWDVEFLVQSKTMLISNVVYRHIQAWMDNPDVIKDVYLQRVSYMEFDMLKAFEVPRMSGTKFVAIYMGCSQALINDDGTKIFMSSREIHDTNVAYICGV